MDLKEACTVWQSGRDDGSSRLHGAARVLTGIPHYFDADFIRKHEEAARSDEASLERARLLMTAIAKSDARAHEEWCADLSIANSGFAGRGLDKKPQDDQILAALESSEITMPLWGISLDRDIALSYGTRFVLQLEGPFH